MRFPFGKHNGRTVASLLLEDPKYIHWMSGQSEPSPAMRRALAEAERLMEKFDAAPLEQGCQQPDCHRQATNCTVSLATEGDVDLFWRCESCTPERAVTGRLPILRTYRDALAHVEKHWDCDLSAYQFFVLTLAQAKGLPEYAGEQEIREFFANAPEPVPEREYRSLVELARR